MPKAEDVLPVLRKILPVIFVLDTSSGMAGEKIVKANEVMREILDILKKCSARNADVVFEVNVLSFSTEAKWYFPQLVAPEDYHLDNLCAEGEANLGNALKELNDKLSCSSMLISPAGFRPPIIFFISDGILSDHWEEALLEINQNNEWFKIATKIAIAVGEDADRDVLAQVLGWLHKDGKIMPYEQAVIAPNDMEVSRITLPLITCPFWEQLFGRDLNTLPYDSANPYSSIAKLIIENYITI